MAMEYLMSLLTRGGGVRGGGNSYGSLTILGLGEVREQVNPHTGGVLRDDPGPPNLVDNCAGEGGRKGLPHSPARWEPVNPGTLSRLSWWGHPRGGETLLDSPSIEGQTDTRPDIKGSTPDMTGQSPALRNTKS